jgi:hypothetical protein
MLEEGWYRSAGELAEAEKVTRSFANRLLRLTLLAPEIAEAILEGRQRRAMAVQELMRAVPSAWTAKRNLVGIPIRDWRKIILYKARNC